jgi:hypothetical protein
MKKILILITIFLHSFLTFSQVQNVTRQELKNYKMEWGLRKIVRKGPVNSLVPEKKFFGNLTADTLIAAISDEVRKNLIITPDWRIIVKPSEKIELNIPFTSVPETETNYTWDGKTIYTQKFLVTWASPDLELVSNVRHLYSARMVDVSINPNGDEVKNLVWLGKPIILNSAKKIIAYRPPLDNNHTAQRAEITIQYTK